MKKDNNNKTTKTTKTTNKTVGFGKRDPAGI